MGLGYKLSKQSIGSQLTFPWIEQRVGLTGAFCWGITAPKHEDRGIETMGRCFHRKVRSTVWCTSTSLSLQKEVIAALPKLIKLNPIVVKEVFNRLLGSHGEQSGNGRAFMPIFYCDCCHQSRDNVVFKGGSVSYICLWLDLSGTCLVIWNCACLNYCVSIIKRRAR